MKNQQGQTETDGLQQEGGEGGSGGIGRTDDEIQGETDEGDEGGPGQPAEDSGQGLDEQARPGGKRWAVPSIESEIIGQRLLIGGGKAAGGIAISVSGGQENGIGRGVGGKVELIGLVSGEGFKPEDELAVAGGI